MVIVEYTATMGSWTPRWAWCWCWCLLVAMVTSQQMVSRDLIPLANITASSTCGQIGADANYTRLSSSHDATVFFCNSTDQHPIEMVTDKTIMQVLSYQFRNPNMATYWQSINTIPTNGSSTVSAVPLQQSIDVVLPASYLIRSVRAIFVAAHDDSSTSEADARPAASVVEIKQTSSSTAWTPMRYFARNCSQSFPGVAIRNLDGSGPKFSWFTPVCEHKYFAGDVTTLSGWGYGRQQVVYNPAREFSIDFANDIATIDAFTVSAIRLRLVKPAEEVTTSGSYYAVADLAVDGHCSCYGHADTCTGQHNETCVCLHNTSGANCNQCLPLFNNSPWKMGQPNATNACIDCGCNGHADSCVYDEVKGYGVCLNCSLNTTGDKCDTCSPHFKRNPLYVATTPNPAVNTTDNSCNGTLCRQWCIACNCSAAGSLASSDYTCDDQNGQCSCKSRVEGVHCDTCQTGYWNLSAGNDLGCQACSCDPAGTSGGENQCHAEYGVCDCMSLTTGDRCNKCKPLSFGLGTSNSTGCTECGCDQGAAIGPECPVDTGVCACRPNISGRQCLNSDLDYAVPRLDSILYEAELTSQAITTNTLVPAKSSISTGLGFLEIVGGVTLTFYVSVPRLAYYYLILRYQSRKDGIAVTVTLRPPTIEVNAYSCLQGGLVVDPGMAKPFYASLPARNQSGSYLIDNVCLLPGSLFPVDIYSTDTLNIDSIVLIPAEELLSPIASKTSLASGGGGGGGLSPPAPAAPLSPCHNSSFSVIRSNNSQDCSAYEFSYMAMFYDGAIQCSCNKRGTISTWSPLSSSSSSFSTTSTTSCDGRTAQCHCLPGVTLRDCSRCSIDHYAFVSGIGCTACDCHPNGSYHMSCSENGVCNCLPNVIGVKCDKCLAGHYGVDSGTGCKACQCDNPYSINNSCNQSTGACLCKTGVAGPNCNYCKPGFYGLTIDGCKKCSCNEYGSFNNLTATTSTSNSTNYPSSSSSSFSSSSSSSSNSSLPTCDAHTGACDCKAAVVPGGQCDTCKPGYFGLGEYSPVQGCMKCFCFGHSTNCSSSPDWSQEIIYISWNLFSDQTALQDKWTGITNYGTAVLVEDLTKITQNLKAEFVLRITKSTSNLTDETAYFSATSSFLGDKRTTYGHTMSFVLRVSSPSDGNTTTDSQVGDVIIQGMYAPYRLIANLGIVADFTKRNYTIKMIESNWFVDYSTVAKGNRSNNNNSTVTTATGIATYEQLMLTLSGVQSLWLRAQYSQEVGTTVDFCGAKVTIASRISFPFIPVYNVEQCICPVGYMGDSCENCDVGYTRGSLYNASSSTTTTATLNPTPTTTSALNPTPTTAPSTRPQSPTNACSPCSCHNHGTACDQLTGACVCAHNTMGLQCDQCQNGYYGVPTNGYQDDCQPCACPAPIGSPNSFSSSCSPIVTLTSRRAFLCQNCSTGHGGNNCETCLPGFYGTPTNVQNNGGSCTPCQCNGRADLCDNITGACLNCTHNTTGTHCEQCAPYYYGSVGSCQPCGCTSLGSTGLCDSRTGQCLCQPFVRSFLCSECQSDSFNYTDRGCDPCDCNPAGSISGGCDVVTGQCLCKLHVNGRKCDKCDLNYWNLNNNTGCDACQCHPMGTMANSTCDPVSGQCSCISPGVIGRSCDTCASGTAEILPYLTTINSGIYPVCSLCGQCYDSWALITNSLFQESRNMSANLAKLLLHFDNQNSSEINSTVTSISNKLQSLNNTIQLLQFLVMDIQQLDILYNQLSEEIANSTLPLSSSSAQLVSLSLRYTSSLDLVASTSAYLANLLNSTTSTSVTSDPYARLTVANATLVAAYTSVYTAYAQLDTNNSTAHALLDDIKASVNALRSTDLSLISRQSQIQASVDASVTSMSAPLDLQTSTLSALAPAVTLASSTANDLSLRSLSSSSSAQRLFDAAALNLQTASTQALLSTSAMEQAQAAISSVFTANTASLDYMNISLGLLSSANSSLNTLISLQTNLGEVEKTCLDIRNQSLQVKSVVLADQANFTATCSAIQAASISEERVNRTLDDARAGLTRANLALNSTTVTSDIAHSVLEEIQDIEYNLNASKSLQETLSKDLQIIDDTINQTFTIKEEQLVYDLANAKDQGSRMTSSLAYSADAVSTTTRCYGDLENKMDAAMQANTVNTNLVNNIQTATLDNTLDVAALTSALDTHYSRDSVLFTTLLQVSEELEVIQGQLAGVNGIADLQILYDQIISQEREITIMHQQYKRFSAEFISLIEDFRRFRRDSVTCSHN